MDNFSRKRLKDPIYGYIEIPVEYVSNILDTPPFQRLRRIIQTNYAPLYPSAVHNRFVHSLGVYHLGSLVAEQLKREITEQNTDLNISDIEKYAELFKLACLLHDVGHAPFSHTGEEFFGDDRRDYTYLHKILLENVGSSKEFEQDIPKDSSKAAALHEIMSSIIGIKEYKDIINKLDNYDGREFFARCITGYQYNKQNTYSNIKNCFISMLNSRVIDVDKLDYLLRDAYTTGFDTVNIDYKRLLSSLTVSNNKIAYYKSAISVIENVVYAHDLERKWIQNHPIVLYEGYILKHVISLLNEKLGELFSIETLSEEGKKFEDIKISLLCDDDIIFLMKSKYVEELKDLSNEFFDRRTRRHPTWKSEAEYKAYILSKLSGGEILDSFEKAMAKTATYLSKNTDSWVIDDKLIEKLEEEEKNIKTSTLDEESKSIQSEDKKLILRVMHSLQSYANENKIECSFVILKASQFNSGFGKPDFTNINIVFRTSEGDKIETVGKIVSSIQAKNSEQNRDAFFYLFYKRQPNSLQISNQKLCERLLRDVCLCDAT